MLISAKISSLIQKYGLKKSLAKVFYYLKLITLYRIRKTLNIPFGYLLPNGSYIKLRSQGQIARSLFMGGFEREETRLFFSFLKSGMYIVDVGANIGLYSILAGLAVGSSGKVFAFGSSTESYKRLLANLALNCVVSVDAIKIALADTQSDILFLKRDPGYKDGDRYLTIRKKENTRALASFGDTGDSEAVGVTTLDRYFYIEKNGKAYVDFLKIDVEGGELSVFRGAKRLLTENSNIMLMFECTARDCLCAGHSQDDVFQFLEDLGFNLYTWDLRHNMWNVDKKHLRCSGNIWACRNRKLLPSFN